MRSLFGNSKCWSIQFCGMVWVGKGRAKMSVRRGGLKKSVVCILVKMFIDGNLALPLKWLCTWINQAGAALNTQCLISRSYMLYCSTWHFHCMECSLIHWLQVITLHDNFTDLTLYMYYTYYKIHFHCTHWFTLIVKLAELWCTIC